MKTSALFIEKVPKYFILLFTLTIISLGFAQEEKPKEEFKPNGKVSGLAFGDFYYKMDGDSVHNFGDAEFSKAKKDNMAITFRRIYLGYDYDVSPNFSTKILLEGNDGILNNEKRSAFVKALYIECKNFIPQASIFIGQSSTPTWSLAEKTWGYRSVEKTIMDFRKLGSSNDLGIAVTGKIDSAGVFGYSVMAGNGRAEKPEDNNFKKVYGSLNAQLLEKKLILEVYGDFEEQLFSNSTGYFNEIRSKTSLHGFVAYKHQLFTLGLEVVEQIQRNYITVKSNGENTDTLNNAPLGISFFAKGAIVKDKLYTFARYDLLNNTCKENYVMPSLSNHYDETFITAGFDFTPNKNVHFMPNIWINSFSDNRTKPANYDINNSSDRAKYYERKADIVLRFTFYYLFK